MQETFAADSTLLWKGSQGLNAVFSPVRANPAETIFDGLKQFGVVEFANVELAAAAAKVSSTRSAAKTALGCFIAIATRIKNVKYNIFFFLFLIFFNGFIINLPGLNKVIDSIL
jgi:hypothetical protein